MLTPAVRLRPGMTISRMASSAIIAARILAALGPLILLTGCGLGCIGAYRDPRCPESYPAAVTAADIQAYRSAEAKRAERAEQGDPSAQFQLAMASYQPETRRYWFCRASSKVHYLQGNAMYRLGQQFEQNLEKIEAYKWYALAAAHPSAMDREAVNGRDRVARSLTAADLEEAGRRVTAWKPGDCGERPTGS